MDFSKIKGRDFSVLEQACERYAIMAFETLNGCLAIGLKSIQYSYRNDRKPGFGEFRAKFIPRKQLGKPARQKQTVVIVWSIEPLASGLWRLHDGIAIEQNFSERKTHVVGWSHDGLCMRFVHDGQVACGSIGHEDHVLCLNEVRV